jgi:hypothetical protein
VPPPLRPPTATHFCYSHYVFKSTPAQTPRNFHFPFAGGSETISFPSPVNTRATELPAPLRIFLEAG